MSSSALRSILASALAMILAVGPVEVLGAEPGPQAQEQEPETEGPEILRPAAQSPVTTPTAEPAEPAEPAAPAEPAEPAEPAAAGHAVMIAEGEALIGQGLFAPGALRLSEAYAAMPPALRVGGWGRQVVVHAAEAFGRAGGSALDPALLEAEHTLLTAYFADLGEARAAARPTAPSDDQERRLGDRLAQVEQALASRDGTPGIHDVGPIDGRGSEGVPSRRERVVAGVLTGVGAAGLVAGGVMVGVGAVAASRAEQQRSMATGEEASLAREAKLGGTLLATFGAIIFSGSVMMLGIGTNRLGQLKERTKLSVIPIRRGLALRARF
ncbi:MAG: hypothetical protein KDK70_07255 [Myxococcales bacterium]|nr:hypothetical protein [Myxococcales bacterium]